MIDSTSMHPDSPIAFQQLFAMQDLLVNSERVGNSSFNLPTVQEEYANIGDIKKIVTGIANHLDDCCEDIKVMLNQIQDYLKIFKSDVRDLVRDYHHRTVYFINKKFDDIYSFYANEKNSLINYLPDLKAELKELIRDVVSEELDGINNKLNAIEQKVDILNGKVSTVEELIGTATTTIVGAVEGVEASIATLGTALTAGFAVLETSIGGVTTLIEGKFIIDKREIYKKIGETESHINKFTGTKIDDVNKFLNDKDKGLPFILQTEVTANIVGESYAKWDSISMYFPSVVFTFVEVTENNKSRRSQIKVRYNKTSQEMTDTDLK